jgi:hypothetical protein
MFFRRKASVPDFAESLIRLHAQRYGYDSLLSMLNKSGIALQDLWSANALVEWVILGSYLVRASVTGNCKADLNLRNAILDDFFVKLYAGLSDFGFREEELPQFEEDIRQRFSEYDSERSGEDPDPLIGFGLSVAKHILEGAPLAEGAVAPRHLAMLTVVHFADSASLVGELFKKSRITG